MKSVVLGSSSCGDLGRVAWFAFLAIAAYLLFIPPETVTAIAIPPDSSEYAVGLVNLLEHGRFGFTLNGTWYPSRYAPWFSIFCLTPAYFLSGGNALCFNWAILVFALALLVFLGFWGRRCGLGRWSLGAAALPLFLPDFVFYSRVVMTEIPYVALFAAAALVFLRFVDRRREVSPLSCLLAGALVAWGGMVRPTFLPMLLPFAVAVLFASDRTWRWRALRIAALTVPCICYEMGNLVYNYAVFGTITRSGYQFWMPIPCDYPELLFRFKHVGPNVRMLLGAPVIQTTLVMIGCSVGYAWAVIAGRFGGMRENRNYLFLLAFLVFQAMVLLALYLGYYWKDTRFFLSVTLCVVPLFLTAARRVLSGRSPTFARIILSLLIAVVAVAFLSAPTQYYVQLPWRQYWLEKAKITAQVLPANSVVIHDGDPNVLDHFCFRRKGIRVLPFARRFDYVIHMIARKSVRKIKAAPTTVMPLIRPEYFADGICQLPFPRTFQECPEQVVRLLAEGRRVFVEQEVLRGESAWEPFQRTLREHGLKSVLLGMWSSPGMAADPIRHLYDMLVFGPGASDARAETRAVYHEIVRAEGGCGK